MVKNQWFVLAGLWGKPRSRKDSKLASEVPKYLLTKEVWLKSQATKNNKYSAETLERLQVNA